MRLCLLILSFCIVSTSIAKVDHFVRYEFNGQVNYGEVIGNQVQPLSGDLFGDFERKGKLISLDQVNLLTPTEAQKVFAVGMNFASHMSSPSDAPPPLFPKLPTSLVASSEVIYLPKGASNVHFEGELVLVIGKQAKEVSEADANSIIFGVTTGNDLTERNWQGRDLQWMRAKASDGFGPVGPMIAVGVDYNNVLLTTKLNGEIVQQENTRFMIHKPAKVVSYLSQFFTLMPGDLIFMGTPGRTRSLSNGDVISVSIDQVGMLENEIRTRKP